MRADIHCCCIQPKIFLSHVFIVITRCFFEVQVLPTLIPKLQLLGPGGEGVHLEFETVLVFTCLESCWTTTDTWQEERVVVQAEKI